MNNKSLVYSALIIMCVVAGARDVAVELLIKGKYLVPVTQVMLIMCLATFVCSSLMSVYQGTFYSSLKKLASHPEMRKDGILLSLFTFASLLTIYAAISTDLGSALSNLVDFGTFPFFTAVLSVLLLNDRKNYLLFILCSVVCVLGLCLLVFPRIEFDQVLSLQSMAWGVLFALLGGFFSGLWAVYIKKLTVLNLDRPMIVSVRLAVSVLVLGAYHFGRGNGHQLSPP